MNHLYFLYINTAASTPLDRHTSRIYRHCCIHHNLLSLMLHRCAVLEYPTDRCSRGLGWIEVLYCTKFLGYIRDVSAQHCSGAYAQFCVIKRKPTVRTTMWYLIWLRVPNRTNHINRMWTTNIASCFEHGVTLVLRTQVYPGVQRMLITYIDISHTYSSTQVLKCLTSITYWLWNTDFSFAGF